MEQAAEKNGRVKNAPAANGQSRAKADKYTYALQPYSAERRSDGWHIARTRPSFTGERMVWSGPFENIETACLSIARHLAVEIADRHTRMIEGHKMKVTDPLYGLKPTTRLRRKAGSVV